MNITECRTLEETLKWIDDHTTNKEEQNWIKIRFDYLLERVKATREIITGGVVFNVRQAEGEDPDNNTPYQGYTLMVRFNKDRDELPNSFDFEWGLFIIVDEDQVIGFRMVNEDTVFEPEVNIQ